MRNIVDIALRLKFILSPFGGSTRRGRVDINTGDWKVAPTIHNLYLNSLHPVQLSCPPLKRGIFGDKY
jgi:hypothetical protein